MLNEIMFDTISLITIINPLAAAAIMLSLVKYSEIKEVSFKASIALFISSLITMLAGGLILKFFGINIPSIKAIGGVILLLISIHMIQGKSVVATKSTQDEHEAAKDLDDISIIPLTIPILFGPGAITTIIVLNEKHHTIEGKGILFIAIILATIITYLSLRNASSISQYLGVNGLKILTRVMGLLIGAIAFLFLIGGIKALWMMP